MNSKLSYSVLEFCELHCISKTKFYALLKNGKAPTCMRVGARLFISCEAAAAWRRRMEILAAEGAAPAAPGENLAR